MILMLKAAGNDDKLKIVTTRQSIYRADFKSQLIVKLLQQVLCFFSCRIRFLFLARIDFDPVDGQTFVATLGPRQRVVDPVGEYPGVSKPGSDFSCCRRPHAGVQNPGEINDRSDVHRSISAIDAMLVALDKQMTFLSIGKPEPVAS